ncbi:MAG: N-acetylglucosamine-6-phosphate deacetylase [Lachnospiraceae bacterium]|nr:N-acetylglucosamine-6-phosphate deacetylase [Lachnospiraceae bacterium]
MLIKNGTVFVRDKKFCRANLVCDEIIREIRMGDAAPENAENKNPSKNFLLVASQEPDDRNEISDDQGQKALHQEVIDASGKYVIPGLIDIHSHGAVNADASDGDAEGIPRMAAFYASRGVTSWCPTTMTLPEQELLGAMRAIRSYAEQENTLDGLYASCLGVHLEGPFLSAEKKGAQAGEHLRKPDMEMLRRLHDASGGRVRMVTVAPEEDADFSFIREASRLCTVSLGHSAADYETAAGAFAAGASHVTHLFNGMNGLHHRNPGIIGAACEAGATVELICDGLHIHPAVIRMAERLFPGNITLISDSMRCAGMPDGEYTLGGQAVFVNDRKATLADGTLAGSSITLADAVRNVIRFGLPAEQAVRYATSVPAAVIGADACLGTIAEGYQADLLILDEAFEPEVVIKKGQVYRRSR